MTHCLVETRNICYDACHDYDNHHADERKNCVDACFDKTCAHVPDLPMDKRVPTNKRDKRVPTNKRVPTEKHVPTEKRVRRRKRAPTEKPSAQPSAQPSETPTRSPMQKLRMPKDKRRPNDEQRRPTNDNRPTDDNRPKVNKPEDDRHPKNYSCCQRVCGEPGKDSSSSKKHQRCWDSCLSTTDAYMDEHCSDQCDDENSSTYYFFGMYVKDQDCNQCARMVCQKVKDEWDH